MIAIDDVLLALGESMAANRILIADCCRDDPSRARGYQMQLRTSQFRRVAEPAFEAFVWHAANGIKFAWTLGVNLFTALA